MTLMRIGQCCHCSEQKLVGPLHLDRGGPDICLPCGTEWHAQQARSRNQGEMQKRFLEMALGKTAYAGSHELTLDLIEEAVRLTYPNKHPPDRAEQAARVTAELLALKPWVLPKPPPPSNTSETVPQCRPQTSVTPPPESATSARRFEELMKSARPCETCHATVSYYYCDACKDWDETRQRERREWDNKRRERDNAQQRERRARLRRLRAYPNKPIKWRHYRLLHPY